MDERVWIGREGVVVEGEGGVVVVLGAVVRLVARAVGGGVGGAFSSSCVAVRVRLDGPAILTKRRGWSGAKQWRCGL